MDYNPSYSKISRRNFLKKSSDDMAEDEPRYKLIDIDHPNGWNFNELETLGDMGFVIDTDTEMVCEIEIPVIEFESEKVPVKIYKNNYGYVIETHRRYVFESFNKMIEFIETTTKPKITS